MFGATVSIGFHFGGGGGGKECISWGCLYILIVMSNLVFELVCFTVGAPFSCGRRSYKQDDTTSLSVLGNSLS